MLVYATVLLLYNRTFGDLQIIADKYGQKCDGKDIANKVIHSQLSWLTG